jgi:hypothetical protein
LFYIGDMDIGWYFVNINDFVDFSVIFVILVELKAVIIIETLNKKNLIFLGLLILLLKL